MAGSSYLVGAARTPVGCLLGGLARIPAPELAAACLRQALLRAQLPPERVDEVFLGNVLSSGLGQAPARQAALLAGCPATTSAVTLNMVCGSGLRAVMLADQAIRSGESRLVAAGGMESMSRAPHVLVDSRWGTRLGHQSLLDSMLHDGLWCAREQVAMGELAERLAESAQVSRESQDRYALESHRRALAAQSAGDFEAELVPLEVRGETLSTDEGVRRTSLEELSRLRPAFRPGGSVTAGNASQISDGAAVVLVADRQTAFACGTPWRARIAASARVATEPHKLFTAPVRAIEQALDQAGWELDQLDQLELNEAFAVQTLACLRELPIPPERVNPRGGAIALGHPIGASGGRVLVTLLHCLAQLASSRCGTETSPIARGVASLCLGGGGAVALAVEMEWGEAAG